MLKPSLSLLAVVSLLVGLLAAGGCSQRHRSLVSEADLAVARGDSLSLEAFLELPDEAREQRQERAEEALKPLTVVMAVQRGIDEILSAPTMSRAPRNRATVPFLGDVLDHLSVALGLDPTRADCWLIRGQLLDLAGDVRQARTSLATAWDVQRTTGANGTESRRLRRDIAVAAAWLERDRGWWDAGLAWLDQADPDIDANDSEAILLRGLLMAGNGSLEEAMRLSYGLPPMAVPVIDQLGMEGRLGRTRHKSDMLKRWLQAEVWMRRGRPDLAWHVIDEVPYWRRMVTLPRRLYQDLGLYAELDRDIAAANLYYALAYIRRDYRSTVMPIPLTCDPVVAGLPRRTLAFYRLDSGVFHGGSLLAYALSTSMLAMLGAETDTGDRYYGLASEALDVCIRRGIAPAVAQAMRGQLRFSRGRYVLAELDLETARAALAARGEIEPRTSHLLGLIAMGRGRSEEAIGLLNESLLAQPGQARVLDALGVASLQLGSRQDARKAFDAAIAAAPDLASAHFNRGLLRAQEGDLDGGLADLATAADLLPEHQQIGRAIQLARLAQRQGRPFMLGLDSEGRWQPAGMDVHAHEGAVFAPEPMGGVDEMRRRVAVLLDDMLADEGDREIAGGLDEAQLARMVADHDADPNPARRKALAFAFVWLDHLDEARRLLAPHWGDDLDSDETLLLLWLDQRSGEQERLRTLARELGAELTLEVDQFVYREAIWGLLGLDGDPTRSMQTTFGRFDVATNRKFPMSGALALIVRSAQWRAALDASATGIGGVPVDPRGATYLYPQSGGDAVQAAVRALTAGKR